MSEQDFEQTIESGHCQCGDETLDWDWESDETAFIAECSCFRKYTMKLTKCLIDVEAEPGHGNED